MRDLNKISPQGFLLSGKRKKLYDKFNVDGKFTISREVCVSKYFN